MSRILIVFLIIFAGCEERPKNGFTTYEKICIDGHIYFKSLRKLAIQLDDDGKPIKCGDK